MARKFLIDGGTIKISAGVDFHSELHKEGNIVKGGGMWASIGPERKIYLYGASVDFGGAEKEDIIEALKNSMLPASFKNYTYYYSRDYDFNRVLLDAVEIYKQDE